MKRLLFYRNTDLAHGMRRQWLRGIRLPTADGDHRRRGRLDGSSRAPILTDRPWPARDGFVRQLIPNVLPFLPNCAAGSIDSAAFFTRDSCQHRGRSLIERNPHSRRLRRGWEREGWIDIAKGVRSGSDKRQRGPSFA